MNKFQDRIRTLLICLCIPLLLLTALSCTAEEEPPAPTENRTNGTVITVRKDSAAISVSLPDGWESRTLTSTEDPLYGTPIVFCLELYPTDAPEITVRLFHTAHPIPLDGTGKDFCDVDFGEDNGRVIKATESFTDADNTKNVMLIWEETPQAYYAEYRLTAAQAEVWENKITELLMTVRIPNE